MTLLSRVLALAPFPVSRPFAFLLVRSRLSLLSVLLSFSFFFAYCLIRVFPRSLFSLGLSSGTRSLSVSSSLVLVLSRSLLLSFSFPLGLVLCSANLGYFRFLMFVLVLFRSISTPPKFILVQSCLLLLTLVQSRCFR